MTVLADHALVTRQFNTSFAEMDALSGRNQTTHGIWLARSPKVSHSCPP